MQSTYTRVLDSFTRVLDGFTRVFVTHTGEYEILASLLVGISNTLQVLRTRYEFTCEFFAFIIPPKVNIFINQGNQNILRLSDNQSYASYLTSNIEKQCNRL